MNYWYVPIDDPARRPWWSEDPPTGNDRNDPTIRIFRMVDLELMEVKGNRRRDEIDGSRLVRDPDNNKFTKGESEAKDLVDNQGWTYV